MNRAILGVGASIRPHEHIARARSMLARDHHLVTESSYVTTKALNRPGDPDFVNGAMLIETERSFDKLRDYLKSVERRLGRVKTADPFGPRTIDLDIVVWNGEVVNSDYHERDFVRNAVREVAPWIHVQGE
ncbi:MAG: 2-amino-4-hydroxy-6-hydroxymethyldihydropteridine diphosphokinase [Chitinivibrionales bacterium]|nr:2-amino-4-hydroxy-6-hydroxymethyldihydropteridine diphosphokinase [Chitinivibrionales bacterium]